MIDNMDAEREYSFSLTERDIITEAVNEFGVCEKSVGTTIQQRDVL